MTVVKRAGTFGLFLNKDKVTFVRELVAAGEKLSEDDKQFIIRRDRAQEEAARSEQVLGGPAKHRPSE